MHSSLHMHGVEVVALAILSWLFFFAFARHSDGVVTWCLLDATVVSLFLLVLQGYSRIIRTFHLHEFFAEHSN